MRPIIVGVDGSENALRAVDRAAALAAGSGAELVLLTVAALPRLLDEDSLPESGADRSFKQEVRELLVDTRPECLEPAQQRARQAGARLVQVIAATGDPVDELTAPAERLKASMLVVGRRGASRIAELLLGSVSKQLVQRSSCPVVVVP
jgi:nucleotide-binding universal stress UspA family protein